jgi:hypothetical protein
MTRKIVFLLLAAAIAAGCAGPNKLAEKSQKELTDGDVWNAWRLATRALDREPMNPRAKAAAAAAAEVISADWQRRIHGLAGVDSLRAAEQVLEFSEFRSNAVNYTTVEVPASWAAEERTIRVSAARLFYAQGKAAMASHRPKAAFASYHQCERYVTNFKDAQTLAGVAYERAVTKVAVLPFTSGGTGLSGREVSERWRDALAQEMAPPNSQFTRILGSDVVTNRMSVAQLSGLSRDEALKLGRKSGAQRIVWGTVGPVRAETQLQFFRDRVSRKVVIKGDDGREVVRWVEVPIEVVARVRDVEVDVNVQVLATYDGTQVAQDRSTRSTRARVLWTSFAPEGDVGQYALVSDALRRENPERAKDMETRWKNVCGESTTLQQVLLARRETRGGGSWDSGTLARIAAGTAFVFLQELPPAQELAMAALAHGWQPLHKELARLDGMDDVDLGVALGND